MKGRQSSGNVLLRVQSSTWNPQAQKNHIFFGFTQVVQCIWIRLGESECGLESAAIWPVFLAPQQQN